MVRLFIIAILGFSLGCAIACNGQKSEEEEYFDQLEAMEESVLVDLESNPEDFELTSPLERLLDEASRLEAPDSLRDEHDRLLAAAGAYLAAAGESEVTNDPQLPGVIDEWDSACAGMLDRGQQAGLELNGLCAYYHASDENDGDQSPPTDSDFSVEIGDGIFGQILDPPPLSPGLTALSEYIEFTTEERTTAIIGLPLSQPQSSTEGVGFYSLIDGEWQRIGNVLLLKDGAVAQGEFDAVPANLIVLRED